MSNRKSNQEVVAGFQLHAKDTGSSEVQIALLTERINHLVDHLKRHKKDHHTRRGLLILVGRRKRLMAYLRRTNLESFTQLVARLQLRVKD